MRVQISFRDREKAEVNVPSAKALLHRALIAASLADGKSVLHNVYWNEDTEATREALESIGASFTCEGKDLIVQGGDLSAFNGTVLDCRSSASTLRFLIPVFSLSGHRCIYTGSKRLLERPMSVYEELFREGTFQRDVPFLRVQGDIRRKRYDIPGNISSQFISGLLFALPLCEDDSEIFIHGEIGSSSYIDLTIDILKKAGITVLRDENHLYVKGNQAYHPFAYEIPADDSQAAFFAAEALLLNKEIRIANSKKDSLQGDHKVYAILKDCGAEIEENEEGTLVIPKEMRPFCADLRDIPDLGPILFTLASRIEGVSVFHNTSRLSFKESDRIISMKEELEKTGAVLEVSENEVRIRGKREFEGETCFDGHGDHRVVMALSILSAMGKRPSVLEGAEAVNKSYPDFFEDLEKTGVNIEKEEIR